MISNKILFLIGLFIAASTFGQKNNLSPIFDISPDSRILALAISDGHNSDLYLFSLDGNKLTRLTNDKGYYSRPVFSPKGGQDYLSFKKSGGRNKRVVFLRPV